MIKKHSKSTGINVTIWRHSGVIDISPVDGTFGFRIAKTGGGWGVYSQPNYSLPHDTIVGEFPDIIHALGSVLEGIIDKM